MGYLAPLGRQGLDIEQSAIGDGAALERLVFIGGEDVDALQKETARPWAETPKPAGWTIGRLGRMDRLRQRQIRRTDNHAQRPRALQRHRDVGRAPWTPCATVATNDPGACGDRDGGSRAFRAGGARRGGAPFRLAFRAGLR